MKKAKYNNPAEVRYDFPHADPVDGYTIFNIGGNNFLRTWLFKITKELLCLVTYRECSSGKPLN
ncbi:MAG: type II toxin-antitoxin system HigB family toxin [Desulfobacterales bacterium]|nr:type II toxin-antitoxin system HigB family toxin [Desulfobacterales bacterium]